MLHQYHYYQYCAWSRSTCLLRHIGRTVTTYATRSGINMLDQRSRQIRNANIRIDFLNKIVWLKIPLVLKYNNQWRCMRKRYIPEVYIRLVHDMQQGVTTCVKSKRGTSEHFEVGIGLHQGSVLSPFLFIMLVDTISQDVRNELPWELLYADDLAIIYVTSTDTQNRLESWQKVLTDNGLKINVAKTEHLLTRENPLPIELNGVIFMV